MTGLARVMLMAGSVMVMASCASFPVHVAYAPSADFERYRTFDWMPQPSHNPAADIVPGFTDRLRGAIGQALARKGLRRAVPGQLSDLRIAFYAHLSVEPRVWVSSWGTRWMPYYVGRGYGWGPSLVAWGPDVFVSSYETGTLVVDIYDERTRRLVWRGWTRDAIDPSDPDDDLIDAVQKVVARFPPSPKRSVPKRGS
jgi:hypothetical protein